MNQLEQPETDRQATQTESLADLPIADEQAKEIKGGPLSSVEYTVTVTDTQTGGTRTRPNDDNSHGTHVAGTIGAVANSLSGSSLTNHNETTLDDGEADSQVYLADLLVADERAEEIKGGPDNVEITVKVLNTIR